MSLRLYETPTYGNHRRLRSISDPEFCKDVLHVNFYGVFRDAQFRSDGFVGLPAHGTPQDLQLALRQFRVAGMFGQRAGRLRRQNESSGMDSANRVA